MLYEIEGLDVQCSKIYILCCVCLRELRMKQVSAAVSPRLLESVNKEFVWEFKRGFVFFPKGKDLNLEGKLSSVKFGLYIPFPSLLFRKKRAQCLPEVLRS